MSASQTVRFDNLRKGSVLGNWTVGEKLGAGAFGAVYHVVHTSTKEKRAMKVEHANEEEDSMLRMEIAVLKSFQASTAPHPHVCDYVDNGLALGLRYVVMKLAGPNLADVRRGCPMGQFTERTTIRLGIQCVRSIESLHQIGFIHRDIKPANHAIGLGDARRTIFLLDFGLARQYVDRKGDLRPPRSRVGFRGTQRYASLNSHLKRDLGRHDDLWCLLYMLIEMQVGKLPWSKADKKDVAKMKKDIVADVLLQGMAQEFHQFLNELQGLQFHDAPKYDYFCGQLEAAMKRIGCRHEDQYDWESATGGTDKIKQLLSFGNPFKRQKKEEKNARKEHGDEERSRLSL